MELPPVDPAGFGTLVLSCILSLIVGGIIGWFGHLLSTSLERQSWKWQELMYWRSRYDDLIKQINYQHPSGALWELKYYADIHPEESLSAVSQEWEMLILDVRNLRHRINALEAELKLPLSKFDADIPEAK